jgi:hypothetical protein
VNEVDRLDRQSSEIHMAHFQIRQSELLPEPNSLTSSLVVRATKTVSPVMATMVPK